LRMGARPNGIASVTKFLEAFVHPLSTCGHDYHGMTSFL
jgi:hypothetical protein